MDGQTTAIGRPTKRDDETEATIINNLMAGCTRAAAYRSAGISKQTFYNWLNDFIDFLDAVEKAEAEAEKRFTYVIQRASVDSWQAGAWWLERRRSEDYGRKDKITLDIDREIAALMEELATGSKAETEGRTQGES